MRITLILLGSRGEIQPYVALAIGLQAAGHAVRIATHGQHAALAQRRGLAFAPIRGDVRALFANAAAPAVLDPQRHPLRFARHGLAALRPLLRGWIADFRAACRDADLIVASEVGLYLGLPVAELAGLPLVRAFIAPKTATAAVASIHAPAWPRWLPGRRRYNRATHAIVGAVTRLAARALFNRQRRDLGLPPLPWRDDWLIGEAPLIYGISPLLAPPAADWPDNHHVCGGWFLAPDDAWQPPAALRRFLAAGDPPVAIGFGSMPVDEPAAMARVIAAALRRAGLRGILLAGWSDLRASRADAGGAPHLLCLPEAPHEWLYPRMAAIVHHGGVGTAGAALRSGMPSLAVPFIADQPFWGRRIAELGAGLPPLNPRRLSADILAERLGRLVGDQQLRAGATRIGALMRREDGVGAAVALIERYR